MSECVICKALEEKGEYGKMSQADKLFEELGYVKTKYNNIVSYWFFENEIATKSVRFYLQFKTFETITSSIRKSFNMQELKAINIKCRELGWSDE